MVKKSQQVKSKVTIGKDGTTPRIRVVLPDGIKYIYPGIKDEIEVKRVALQIEQDLQQDNFDYSGKRYKFVPEKKVNLKTEEAVDFWIKSTKKSLSPNTQKAYRGTLNLLKDSGLGNLPLKAFNRQKAYDFLKHCQKLKLKSSTISKRLKDCQSCWMWLISQGFISENPWGEITKNFKSGKTNIDPFSKEEVTLILEGFKDSRFLPIIRFMLGTGARTGEAIGLRWSDLNPQLTNCTISTQITKGERRATKNGKIRSFQLPANLTEMLRQLPKTGELIFETDSGRPICPDVLFKAWTKILEEQGVRYRRIYNCRHTFISHALQSGMAAPSIAQITGHELNTLFKYYAGFVGGEVRVPQLW